MPKLYHNGQREGWQIPGQQDKSAARIDIPSAPAELAAWLNHRRVGPTGLAVEHERQLEELAGDEEPETKLASAPQKPRVDGFCDTCGRSAAGTLKLAQGNDLSAFAEWLETAELWAMQRAVELVRDRIHLIGRTLDAEGAIN